MVLKVQVHFLKLRLAYLFSFDLIYALFNFFFKALKQSASNEFEKEKRKEQEERRKLNEEKRVKREEFMAKKSFFNK